MTCHYLDGQTSAFGIQSGRFLQDREKVSILRSVSYTFIGSENAMIMDFVSP